MRPSRRDLMLAGAAAALSPRPGTAQGWAPTRDVRLITGFPPGGTTDIVARLLAEALRPRAGQPVVVDPRPGANGYLGAQAASRAAPDGHTLFLTQLGIMSVGPVVPGVTVGLDLDRDLVPLACLVGTPMVLVVRPGAPFADVDAFLAAARARPGGLTYGSAGNGSINHLAMERFAALNGVSLVHVPYRGGAPAATDLGAGRVDAMFANLAESLGPIAGGRMVPLALAGEGPSGALPDAPLLSARFPGFSVLNWFGIAAPAGLPEPARAFWEGALLGALADPAVRRGFAERALDPVLEDGATFARRIAGERARWRQVVEAGNIRAD
ncbi:Bug family tripartite tricarboxylate transporter substrate binding protein [Muricoccus radiodurans]|uniref:Bug family tripartite tricarboxylate transporter substrate binding protein n=1 Tax=Muricoccus radiodurans TaxID=2231721 RepID=UPI003CEC7A25